MTMAHVELDPGQVELTFQPRFGIQTAEQSHLMRNAVSSSGLVVMLIGTTSRQKTAAWMCGIKVKHLQ